MSRSVLFWWRSTVSARVAVLATTIALFCAVGASAGARAPGNHPVFSHHAAVVNGDLIGSAVAVNERLLVTAGHILKGRRKGDIVRLVMPGARPAVSQATIIGFDANMDLAVVATAHPILAPARIQAAALPRNAALLAAGVDAASGPYARRLAKGSVQVRRSHQPGFGTGLIADLPDALPGFSGGPVFDQDGHLVGILCAISGSRDRRAFILPAREVVSAVRAILAH